MMEAADLSKESKEFQNGYARALIDVLTQALMDKKAEAAKPTMGTGDGYEAWLQRTGFPNNTESFMAYRKETEGSL